MAALQKLLAAVSAAVLAGTLLGGCGSSKAPGVMQSSAPTPGALSSASSAQAPPGASSRTSSGEADSLAYQNVQYGFTFTLPEDWKDYTIVTDQWAGSTEENGSEQTAATGPQLSIRDPRWTEAHKRQDIPIMIFTLEQWNDLQQDKFHIGAAPIGPSELGRNNKYVFALPARYNFAYDDGYEEVETILAGNPLQASQLS